MTRARPQGSEGRRAGSAHSPRWAAAVMRGTTLRTGLCRGSGDDADCLEQRDRLGACPRGRREPLRPPEFSGGLSGILAGEVFLSFLFPANLLKSLVAGAGFAECYTVAEHYWIDLK